MRLRRLPLHRLLVASLLIFLFTTGCGNSRPRKVVFEGELSEHRWALADLNSDLPSDWSSYEYLVLEFRHSSPQRFFLFVYDKEGPRRVVIQPFGQDVWIRAAVPLKYFERRDFGRNMASVNNRGANSFWMSVWGPFGPIDSVEAIGVTMQYPLGRPTLELRSVQLTKEDPGSEILEKLPVVDKFGQWIHADWPRKIRSLEQLEQEWATEDSALESGEFNYGRYGGYKDTLVEATGFFRLERVDGKWWFVDPDGHLFLSLYVPGLGSGGFPTRTEGREDYYAALPPEDLTAPIPGYTIEGPASFHAWNLFRRYGPDWRNKATGMTIRRMEHWGLTTGPGPWFLDGSNPDFQPVKPYLTLFSVPLDSTTTFLGLPDVYSDEFVTKVDQAAAEQMAPRRDDPLLLGYFVGNEPPWPGREEELVDLILAGPPTAMQQEAKSFLAEADTPERRQRFIHRAFEKYLEIINGACRKHDPNHLNVGMRFGGQPPDYLLEMGRVFDVCSLNPYEYSPVEHMDRVHELTGRPILFGEFQFGVPENGLGGSLVQTANQEERGVAYRYYLERAAAHPAFVGAGWFVGFDEPVTGAGDTENYNIGFVDVTDRPYPELVRAARESHKRLFDLHTGKIPPIDRRPKASEAGTPSYRLSDSF
ncbi:MAG: hypothetical protein GY953_22940 [bacterium]|nr:hypothetical protein [bacterium]